MDIPATDSKGDRTAARRAVVVLLCIEAALLLASIPHHSPDVDEAWFAEEAWFKAKDGYPHSNFFKGFVHEDERIVVHHYLFVLLESLVFRAVGFGLGSARIVPLASAMVLLALMVFYGRRAGVPSRQIALAALAFLLAPQAFRSCNLARPEMLGTAFGFGSFVLLWNEQRLPAWGSVLGAGACAGAAMLTHLNGAIFVGTGIVMLLASGRPSKALGFAAVAAVAFSPYAVEAVTHLDLFKEQITSPLIAYKTEVGLLQPFLNLSREHMRLFRKPDLILLTCVFLASALVCVPRPRPEDRFLLRYLLVLMIALGALVADKGAFYSVYLVPFEALVIGAAAMRWNEAALHKGARVLLGTTAALFVGWGLFAQLSDVADKQDVVALNREIGGHLPADAWTVAPMAMAFDELERRLLVADHLLLKATRERATFDDLAAFCDAKGATHAVIYRVDGRLDGYVEDGPRRAALFDTIQDDRRFLVLRRRSPVLGVQRP